VRGLFRSPGAALHPTFHRRSFTLKPVFVPGGAMDAGTLAVSSFNAMATKHLHIDRTATSPEIDLDLEHGQIAFIGRSLPANSEDFYGRVYRWLDEYLKQPKKETVVNMRMDYLDTSSSKHFFNIFDRLNTVNERGQHVQVKWHYETGDDEMAETGKDFQSFFNMDFDFVEVKELF
jgi:SiaC family regulatory phosphoprotein